MNQLIELNMYIDIKQNTYPTFEEDLQTSFTLSVNDTYEYVFPNLIDKEGNDIPEVLVVPMIDTPEIKYEYPPFMFYNDVTKTLSFRPDSEWY